MLLRGISGSLSVWILFIYSRGWRELSLERKERNIIMLHEFMVLAFPCLGEIFLDFFFWMSVWHFTMPT